MNYILSYLRAVSCAAVCCFLLQNSLLAQQKSAASARNQVMEYVRAHTAELGLTPADVLNMRVSSEYVSEHNGVTHVWLQQEHAGIPVYNGLFGLHVAPDGQIAYVDHRFVPDLAAKVNTRLPSLGAARSVEIVARQLGFDGFSLPRLKQKMDEREMTFDAGAIARSDIKTQAVYYPQGDGTVRLGWAMNFDPVQSADSWTMVIDAQTGQVIGQYNNTIYCKAGHAHVRGSDCNDDHKTVTAEDKPALTLKSAATAATRGTYRVFALPTESPAHGPRTLVENPADPVASPFGWHDIDGVEGAEYTYTRGNNVFAYDDIKADNNGLPVEAAEGGADLKFDFPFNPDAEPVDNRDASVTNLFYVGNFVHDFTYRYGFTEAAGNFQANNYGKGGRANDAVQAEGIDNGDVNNANFLTLSDGTPGKMQMFKWTAAGDVVKVNAPTGVAGRFYAVPTNGWGARITTTPVTGLVEIGTDGTGSSDNTLGCAPIKNDVKGKVVILDRGICQFGVKALAAQTAGAIGCIICNFEDNAIQMDAGNVGDQVKIPTVMMTKLDCDRLRLFAGEGGLNISFVQPEKSGPGFLDGGFDNGIVAHEYGHGVSNRLTGGPNKSFSCLQNGEQMGEGWSDWLTLVTTLKQSDVPKLRRGVGTYVERQPNEGTGIRRYPYSTDFTVNPSTFATVAENPAVHALGAVWATMLWDLHWALVERYGFDADWRNTRSGNGRAIQLVMDGMKMQPCNPGFIDGRNAILLANKMSFQGADTCLISEIFARRGLGFFANQGAAASGSDGVENFDPIPTCLKTVKINKTIVQTTINPGGESDFRISVANHKDAAVTNLVITDDLPAGLSLVSASNGGKVEGSMVRWTLPSLGVNERVVLTYRVKAADDKGSISLFRDPMDAATQDDWFPSANEGTNLFELQATTARVGKESWLAAVSNNNDMTLEIIEPFLVSGKRPVLRFWHQYNSESGADAGFIEVSKATTTGDPVWQRLPDAGGLRNPYPRKVAYSTFAIPFLSGFSGNSNGWQQSYFDLTPYIGEKIALRFRFGTDAELIANEKAWYVDEVEMIDLLNYDTEACVTTAQGDKPCARMGQSGLIVNPVGSTQLSVNEKADQLAWQVQPNPADDLLYVTFNQSLRSDARMLLFAADGRVALEQNLGSIAAGQALSLDIQSIPAGVYMLRLESAEGIGIKQIVVQ